MSNIGPIINAQQQKTGKEFLNELFEPNEDDEQIIQTHREIEKNVNESMSRDSDNSDLSGALQEAEKSQIKFPEETSQFADENHDIILNLSKYTLRKIVMLICDEAVSLIYFVFYL